MATMARDEAERRLRELQQGWALEGDAIRKQFVFKGFPEAVDFVSRLVPHAEAADHHPDVLINYKRVTLTYSTHSEGGLTSKDFDGARMAERVAAEKAV
jgi:4a-hydroxytetrahydrobiopterin dehydratase